MFATLVSVPRPLVLPLVLPLILPLGLPLVLPVGVAYVLPRVCTHQPLLISLDTPYAQLPWLPCFIANAPAHPLVSPPLRSL